MYLRIRLTILFSIFIKTQIQVVIIRSVNNFETKGNVKKKFVLAYYYAVSSLSISYFVEFKMISKCTFLGVWEVY